MEYFLIDSHAHVNFNAYKDDGDEVIRRSLAKGIGMINVGSQIDTSRRALEMANKYDDGVWVAIGIHPIHLSKTEVDEEEIYFKTREEKFEEKIYQELIDSDKKNPPSLKATAWQGKIVAVGEIGFDYYHVPPVHESIKTLKQPSFAKASEGKENKEEESQKVDWKEYQQEQFIEQLKFASKNNLPMVLHCRGSAEDPYDAYDDLFQILKEQIDKGLILRGVVHCYGGNLEQAKKFVGMGFYIGFTGIITFGRNADDLREVARQIPLNKILVETDAPYLAPDPHRGERNEPAYVEFVARKLAEIKNISVEEVSKVTVENTRELFNI